MPPVIVCMPVSTVDGDLVQLAHSAGLVGMCSLGTLSLSWNSVNNLSGSHISIVNLCKTNFPFSLVNEIYSTMTAI